MTKSESSTAGPAKQTSQQTSAYNPHSTSTWQGFSFSPCLRWGQVAEHVGSCPRTDRCKLRWGPRQSMPRSGARGLQPWATPSSFQHWECLSRLQISCVLKQWWQEPGKYTDRGMVAKCIPRSGTSQRASECGPRAEGACLPPLSAEFRNPREHWEIQRKNTFLFYFGFLHSGVDESQLVELTDNEPMPREHLSAFSNTPTNRMQMGGAPLKSVGLSPGSYCSTAQGPASLQASRTTWLEDTSSVGKERG